MSRGVPFQPGNRKGRGRPRGSSNKSTLLWPQLLSEYGEPLVRKCIAMALKENPVAMRVCMERLVPLRRDLPVQVRLPTVRTAAELDSALNAVLDAVARGKLSPTESRQLVEILENKRRMIETREIEERIQKLESITPNP
jgi:hypothetical protein